MKPRPLPRLSESEARVQAAIMEAPTPKSLKRARAQKAKIEAYWAERGRAVEIELVPIRLPNGGTPDNTVRDYAFVSNIGPNGFPPPAGEAAP